MPIVKPPISPDVADIIGVCAEKVENRSLLLGKFTIHKSWPASNGQGRRMDDGPRWSFIRVAENGEEILRREAETQERRSKGQNASPENREEPRENAEAIKLLLSCKCRTLSSSVEEMRKAHVDHLIDLVKKSSMGHRVVFGRLESRLAINLSDSLIQNAGICLDRFFGVPYIPGSAVKGVCRHIALADLRSGKMSLEDFQDIFGTADTDFSEKGELASFRNSKPGNALLGDKKGCVDFLAAYPRSETKLVVDLTNVHYPDYYKSGNSDDLATEKPLPNPFPVVESGAEFAFCIAINSMGGRIESDSRRNSLLDATAGLLRRAISESGLGAKTGAGYGWFADETDSIAKRREEEVAKRAEDLKRAAEEVARNERIRQDMEECGTLLKQLEAKEALDAADRAAAAQIERKLGELPQDRAVSLRDRLNVQKKRLPAESVADKLAALHPNELIAKYIAGFAKLKEEEQTAVVEFLRTEGGRKIWKDIHTDKKLVKRCNGGADIHAFLKQKGLPKIPQ